MVLPAAPAVPSPSAGYISDMTNPYGITLDEASIRWAAAEGVSETVITAVLLRHERSVDEVAAKLRPDELAHVVNLRPRSKKRRVAIAPAAW